MEFLSNIGFPLTRMNFYRGNTWKGGEMRGTNVTAYMGNIQIGDCVYIDTIPFNKKIQSIADIEFGLERMLWVLLRTEKYGDGFHPTWCAREFSYEAMDAIRTLTLLVGDGIKGGNKGQVAIVRELAKEYVEEKGSLHIGELIAEYYGYWNSLMRLSSEDETQQGVKSEIYRAYNHQMYKKLGISPGRDDLRIHPADCVRMLKSKGLTTNQIIDVIRR